MRGAYGVSHYIYHATQRYVTIYVTDSYLLFFLLARNLLNLSFARLLLAGWYDSECKDEEDCKDEESERCVDSLL